jgi:CRISPR-associated protein Cas2
VTVFVLERATPSARGELTRWCLEVRPGVFVGSVSGEVRERLWAMLVASHTVGAVTMIRSVPGEQRFALRSHGDPGRTVTEWDGLQLITRPAQP